MSVNQRGDLALSNNMDTTNPSVSASSQAQSAQATVLSDTKKQCLGEQLQRLSQLLGDDATSAADIELVKQQLATMQAEVSRPTMPLYRES